MSSLVLVRANTRMCPGAAPGYCVGLLAPASLAGDRRELISRAQHLPNWLGQLRYAVPPPYWRGIISRAQHPELELAPLPPIAMDHGLSNLRPPGLARRVVGKIARWQRLPDVQHRHRDVPRRLDDVVTLEQRSIANHRVVQERLVACARFGPEEVIVVKIHTHRLETYRRARNFRFQSPRDALLRLDMEHQSVRLKLHGTGMLEQHMRRLPKLNRHFGQALGHGLAGAQVEWHASPAPVLDKQLHGRIRLRIRRRRHTRFLAI